MSAFINLIDEKKKLQVELDLINEQLFKFKENLDELLQEKDSLDKVSTSLSNEIQNCR